MQEMTQTGSEFYYLGVDGGGSKTLAVVVDANGQERGRGLTGSSNYAILGLKQALASIYSAVEQAIQAANCRLPLQGAWLGVSGLDREEDHAILLPHLSSLAHNVHVSNDAELLLSALDGATGVALIAGTGSIALGRDAHNKTTRAGGWGYVMGDEGSGYEIGRQALQAAARAADGRGEPTILLDLILQHWHLEKADDMIAEVYPDEDKGKIARLSTYVFQAARQGDASAQAIVDLATHELALAALTVGNGLDLSPALPLALGGGLLIHEADLRERVLHQIQRQRSTGQVALVAQPALSAAQAAIALFEQVREPL
jgi:N-acetylglucosamine kinase-like BadF-type ATPase